MTVRKTLTTVAALSSLAVAGLVAFGWRGAIAPIVPPDVRSFDATVIARGAELATIGNCITCHTTPGGHAFAGGLAVPTPFGTIYSTNLTPDAETGIGRWSEEAFRRALRQGVDREGRQLYPAFPYDHFTLVTDGDDRALYAYFMTRTRVQASVPANNLRFPFNIRLLVAGWKLLFFREGPYRPDPARDEASNRGAYLVEGLAHCGACHTPRNALGAEKAQARFAGGEADGWTAYALDQSSPAPVAWTPDALKSYLRNGWDDLHGIARGPMAPVIDNLATIPEADLQAIATYMAEALGQPSPERERAAQVLIDRVRKRAPESKPATTESQTVGLARQDAADAGEPIYQSVCAGCHPGGRPLPFGGIDLALSTGPSGPDARNLINVVLWGLPPADGARSPIMPGFANILTDQQLADLVAYVRSQFSDQPPWSDVAREIGDARRPGRLYPTHGTDPAQPIVSQRETR